MSIPGQIPAGNRLKREFYLINQIPPGHDRERQDMNTILKFSWHSTMRTTWSIVPIATLN